MTQAGDGIGDGGSAVRPRGLRCLGRACQGSRERCVLRTRATDDAGRRWHRRRRQCRQTALPQLGSSSATRKEEPQPQEATTFGFETSKPEPWKLSVKSTVEPSTYCRLAGSTSTRIELASKTWSSSRRSSSASAYWKPEQPPPRTPTRRPMSPSAVWPLMKARTFSAAMSVSWTIRADCIGDLVDTLDLRMPSPDELKERIKAALPGAEVDV